MDIDISTISLIIGIIGVATALMSVVFLIGRSVAEFRMELEELRNTSDSVSYKTEMVVEESLKKAIDLIQTPSDLIPLVNDKIKAIETELKNTKDDISPFLQLIKNDNPKFTTVEGYFFFYMINQITGDLDRVQENIMTDVDGKITTHFSRINLIFGILSALILGLVFMYVFS